MKIFMEKAGGLRTGKSLKIVTRCEHSHRHYKTYKTY